MEYPIGVQNEPHSLVAQARLHERRVGLVEMRADDHLLDLLGLRHQQVESLEPDRRPGDGYSTRSTFLDEPDQL